MSKRWQYKVVEVKGGLTGLKPGRIEEVLAPLGMQGWELASAVQHGLSTWLYLKKEY
jgi:hypothetical protein